MFYLQLYYKNGETKHQQCRSLAYAKREADLLRSEERDRLKKIEICRFDNEASIQIIEAFYFNKM